MTTKMRDPQFATYVDTIAESITWPESTFRLSSWEAFVGTLVALYQAVSAPSPVILQQALRGTAF